MTPHQTATDCLWGDAGRAETREALMKIHGLSADQADDVITDVQHNIWRRIVAANPHINLGRRTP